MKKITNIALAILCLPCLLISCTKDKSRPTARAIQIIIDTYYVYEPNPLYLDEAKEINELFRHSLNNRGKLKSDERQKIYSKAIAAYEANDESALEDAVDETRVIMMQSLCMATAAIVSPPEEAIKYFESAKGSLAEGGELDELMEDQYSALLVLEILYLSEHKMLTETHKESVIFTIRKFTNFPKKSEAAFIEIIKEF